VFRGLVPSEELVSQLPLEDNVSILFAFHVSKARDYPQTEFESSFFSIDDPSSLKMFLDTLYVVALRDINYYPPGDCFKPG
jgi:hypothetical protein